VEVKFIIKDGGRADRVWWGSGPVVARLMDLDGAEAQTVVVG
jgi:hypothetical protein